MGFVKRALSANQFSGFLNQLYLKSNWVSQHEFLYAEIDSKNIRGGLKIFSWSKSKMLLANQIAEFLNQLYLKQELMNERDFSLADIDSINIKGGF